MTEVLERWEGLTAVAGDEVFPEGGVAIFIPGAKLRQPTKAECREALKAAGYSASADGLHGPEGRCLLDLGDRKPEADFWHALAFVISGAGIGDWSVAIPAGVFLEE